MTRIDTKFLLLASLLLICGVSMGIYMAGNKDFSLAPVHAHINLLGWASLALFGIVYRIYPEIAETRMATLHFLLAAPAAILFPIGIVLAVKTGQELVVIVAALMWLTGCILFAVQLAGLAFRRAPAARLAEAS